MTVPVHDYHTSEHLHVICGEDRRYGVNNGYYGVTDRTRTRWSVESITPNTITAAQSLAGLADRITALVEQQAGAAQGAADRLAGAIATGGNEAQRMGMLALGFMFDRGGDSDRKPQARLTAELADGRWTIREYDFGGWTAVIPEEVTA